MNESSVNAGIIHSKLTPSLLSSSSPSSPERLICGGPVGRGESIVEHEQRNEDGVDGSPGSGYVHPHICRGGGDGIGAGHLSATQVGGHACV